MDISPTSDNNISSTIASILQVCIPVLFVICFHRGFPFVYHFRILFQTFASLYLLPSLPSIFGVSEYVQTVLPSQCDLNFHMNNAEYLSICDFGRLDLLIRNGMRPLCKQNKFKLFNGSVYSTFIRQIRPFSTFKLRSRILCWNEKWFVIQQQFVDNNSPNICYAVVYSRIVFKESNGKTIAPSTIAGMLQWEDEAPVIPSVAECVLKLGTLSVIEQ